MSPPHRTLRRSSPFCDQLWHETREHALVVCATRYAFSRSGLHAHVQHYEHNASLPDEARGSATHGTILGYAIDRRSAATLVYLCLPLPNRRRRIEHPKDSTVRRQAHAAPPDGRPCLPSPSCEGARPPAPPATNGAALDPRAQRGRMASTLCVARPVRPPSPAQP